MWVERWFVQYSSWEVVGREAVPASMAEDWGKVRRGAWAEGFGRLFREGGGETEVWREAGGVIRSLMVFWGASSSEVDVLSRL